MNKKILLIALLFLIAIGVGVYLVAYQNGEDEQADEETTTQQVESTPSDEAVVEDSDNPFFAADEVAPIPGNNQQLHGETIAMLNEVFDDIRLIEVNSSTDDFQDREQLKYIASEQITIEQALAVREQIVDSGYDISSSKSDTTEYGFTYEAELGDTTYTGTMTLYIGEQRYEWNAQVISLDFRHRN